MLAGNEYGVRVLPNPLDLTFGDAVLSVALGILAFAAIGLLGTWVLPPEMWAQAVVGAGIKPPEAIFPGLWRLLSRGVFALWGVSAGSQVLVLLGHLALGLAASLVYLIGRGILVFLVRSQSATGIWNGFLSRLLAAFGAVAFVCADPVWRATLAFGETTLSMLLLLLATVFFVRFLVMGSVRSAVVAVVVLGLLSAESLLGFVLLTAFIVVSVIALKGGWLQHIDFFQMFENQCSKWRFTSYWAFGLLLGIAANVVGFVEFGGLAANGLFADDLPMLYLMRYLRLAGSSASLLGWILGFALAVVPCILSFVRFLRATEPEFFLKYQDGIAFFFLGLFAYSQFSPFRAVWFWTWRRFAELIPGQLLLVFFVFLLALTLLLACSVVLFDLFCRDHDRIAARLEPFGTELPPAVEMKLSGVQRVVLLAVAAVLALGLFWGRVQPRSNEILNVVQDYVCEVVDEAGDAKWLFTDGSCDDGILLESRARAGSLVCIPLDINQSASVVWSVSQSLLDAEDKLSAEECGANLLSTWQRNKPERLAESALQVGHELWRRSARPFPSVSGVLARVPGKMTEEERAAGFARARAIADAIIALYPSGTPKSYFARVRAPAEGLFMNRVFCLMQWRLARFASLRAQTADRAGDVALAEKEAALARALDDKNPAYQRILVGMKRLKDMTMRQMTPREGLQFALVRADFALARQYALPILDANPDDLDANFAMAMCYGAERQFARAEEHFRRYLKVNEKEPAVWNNLAVVLLNDGRANEALDCAKRALELIPDSLEVKDTIRDILQVQQPPPKDEAAPVPAEKTDDPS